MVGESSTAAAGASCEPEAVKAGLARLEMVIGAARVDWREIAAQCRETDMRLASVLVPVVMREAPTVLLTRRSALLRGHAGQVCFPGGRAEAQDRGPVATALRETAEEIGLAPDAVRVLGCLPTLRTRTSRHLVVPVVGAVAPQATWRRAPAEVAEVFELPLEALVDAAPFVYAAGERQGAWHWPVEGRDIWGLTAGILVSLARALRSATPELL